MTRLATLLRGVNLGGRNLLMADLARIYEGLGYRDVKTLLASGNVVFSAPGDPRAIEAALEAALRTHGLETDVLVRDKGELAAAIEANPFADAARERPGHLLVTFHRESFPVELLDRVAGNYDGPERLAAVGRELFIDYPDGVGASLLGRAMAKLKFPKIATARNWNTLGKLFDLL